MYFSYFISVQSCRNHFQNNVIKRKLDIIVLKVHKQFNNLMKFRNNHLNNQLTF